jgi:hypothetical protein
METGEQVEVPFDRLTDYLKEQVEQRASNAVPDAA